jgi:cytidylate kinase
VKGGWVMALITVSGGMGCGADKVARYVSEKAKLTLYDDRKLQIEATRLGVRSQELKGFDEKVPGFFDSLRGYNPELYVDLMESVIYELSRSGNGVILGHGSQLLLRDFRCALHVLMFASEDYRIKQVMANHGLSGKAAEKMISKSDSERRGFMHFAFKMDLDDMSLYDLVLNPEKIGVEGAGRLVLEALEVQAVKECSLNALETMERMALLKKVQAALLKARFGFVQFNVDVPEKGVVHLFGFAANEEEKKQMIAEVKKVAGVSKVKDEVGVLPPGGY